MAKAKTWEEIKAERKGKNRTWDDIKKERGYVEPQATNPAEPTAGAENKNYPKPGNITGGSGMAMIKGGAQMIANTKARQQENREHNNPGTSTIRSTAQFVENKKAQQQDGGTQQSANAPTAMGISASKNAQNARRYSVDYGKQLNDKIAAAEQAVVSSGGTRESEDALAAARQERENWKNEYIGYLGMAAAEDFKRYADAMSVATTVGVPGFSDGSEDKIKQQIMKKYGMDEETFELVWSFYRLHGIELADYVAGRAVSGAAGAVQGLMQTADYLAGDLLSPAGALIDSTLYGFGVNTDIGGGMERWAQNAWNTDVIGADALRQGVENRYGGRAKGKTTEFVGDLAESAGAMLPAMATAGAAGVAGLSSGMAQALNSIVFGGGAAGNAAKQALAAGANVEQAVTYGIASGMIEVLTESMFAGMAGMNKSAAMDEVLDKLTENGTIRALMDILGEGAEEIVSEFLNPYITRATYNKDAAVASFEELARSFASGAALSVILGGVSAAMRGEMPAIADNLDGTSEQLVLQDKYGRVDEQRERNTYAPRDLTSEAYTMASRVYSDDTGDTINVGGERVEIPTTDRALIALIESGLESPQGSDSRRLAEAALEKVMAGKSVNTRERGRLAEANEAQIEREMRSGMYAEADAVEVADAAEAESGEGDPLTRAVWAATQGEPVSNSMASAILSSPEAISTLNWEAGLKLRQGMSASQQRSAVKRAVETLAQQRAEELEQASGRLGVPTPVEVRQPEAVVQPGLEIINAEREAVSTEPETVITAEASTESTTGPTTEPNAETIENVELPEPKGESAERSAGDQQRELARSIGDAVQESGAARVSGAELGIKDTTDLKTVVLLDENMAKRFDLSAARAIAEQAGYTPEFFSGLLQMSDNTPADWGAAGKTLYIRADSAKRTAAKIAQDAIKTLATTDAEAYDNSKAGKTGEKKGDTDDAEISVGRRGWNAGRDTVGEAGRLSGEGERAARRAADRRNRAAAYGQISPRDLGIPDGSRGVTVKIVPVAEYDGELKKIAAALERQGVKDYTFVVGQIVVEDEASGRKTAANGVYNELHDSMIIRVDNPRYTASQLASHEMFHRLAAQDKGLINRTRQRLLEHMSEEELHELAEKYQTACGNIYGKDAEAYVEEILADAYAGINRKDLNADRYTESIREEVADSRSRVETRERQTNGPNEDGRTAKFSIERTSQMTLAEQLKMFYDGKMARSDAFYFGETPAVLKKSGFDARPLIMTISDFRKSTQKKHNVPRRVIDNLMSNLANPLFSFKRGDRSGIVLDDIDGGGYKLLAALQSGVDMERKPVNVINSLYGLEHPAEWLKNQIDRGSEFVLYDEKRANAFLQTYGYLASVGDGIHSMDESITENTPEVKRKLSAEDEIEDTSVERIVQRETAAAAAVAREEQSPERMADRMMNSKGDFTASPALDRLGVKITNSIGKYHNIEQLVSNAKAARTLRKAREKAEKDLNVTAKEKAFARGIAEGIYLESEIPKDWDKRTILELADWYMAERNFGELFVERVKRALREDVEQATEDIFDGIEEATHKVSSPLVMNYRTATRNMLNMFGNEKGTEINKWLFEPVTKNEAERLRFINRELDKVRTFEDREGKERALSKEERELVQKEIEGRAVENRVERLEEYKRKEVKDWAENLLLKSQNALSEPDEVGIYYSLTAEEEKLAEAYADWITTKARIEAADSTIIRKAADRYSELFKEYYAAINDFLAAHGYQPIGFIEGYAPHLQPEVVQNAFQNALTRLGINENVSSLPTSVAGITADLRPNKKWNPYFLSRNGTTTQFDIVKAFESYIANLSEVLYHTDDIMRVRSAVRYFREQYSPEEIHNTIDWAKTLRTLPTNDKKQALMAWGIISDPQISEKDARTLLDKFVDGQFEKIEKTTKYNNLVTYLENYANILAGKQSFADRGSEYLLGRKILNVGNEITRIFSRANVAGNLSSALNQSAQLPTLLAENGLRNTANAFKDVVTGELRKAGWADESDFLTGKKGVEFIAADVSDMLTDMAFKPLQMVDGALSAMAVRSSYLKAIAQGMEHAEAMEYADKKAASIMGDRTKGAKPLAFGSKNPVSSMINLFQLEALNSWEHITQDIPNDFRQIEAAHGRSKAARAIANVLTKTLLYTFLLNRLAEKLYGGTPAPFDIFGLTANFIASGQGMSTNSYLEAVIDSVLMALFGVSIFDTDEEEIMRLKDDEFDVAAGFEDLTYNVSNEIPFLNNLSALLGLGDQTLPLPDVIGPVEGVIDGVRNRSIAEAFDSAVAGLGEVLPGGRQIVKTYTGAKMLAQGGKVKGYGDQQRLQYPVERNIGNAVRALLFGASGLQETQDYYASGAKSLSTKETNLWKLLTAAGADEEEAYNLIYAAKTGENEWERVQIMAATDWTDEMKYQAMRGVASENNGYKISVVENSGINADVYAELLTAIYAAAEEREMELPEEERAERITVTQADATAVLREAEGLSRAEKATIWQMINAGWSSTANPFSKFTGRRAKKQYEELKKGEEDEVEPMQLKE